MDQPHGHDIELPEMFRSRTGLRRCIFDLETHSSRSEGLIQRCLCRELIARDIEAMAFGFWETFSDSSEPDTASTSDVCNSEVFARVDGNGWVDVKWEASEEIVVLLVQSMHVQLRVSLDCNKNEPLGLFGVSRQDVDVVARVGHLDKCFNFEVDWREKKEKE